MLTRIRANWITLSFLGECKMVTDTMENSFPVSYKTSMQLPQDITFVLLGIYHRAMKIYVHIKICTWIFIAALFIKAKN